MTSLEQAVAALDLDELSEARWFAGSGQRPRAVRLVDSLEVPGSDGGWLVLANVTHADGGTERYLLPARIGTGGTLDDAAPADPFWSALARAITKGSPLTGSRGSFTAVAGEIVAETLSGGRALTDDQSNTSVVLSERLVVKCYRRPQNGTHPEPELLAGLARVGSRWAPTFGGSLVRESPGGVETLACVYAFVPGDPLGWDGLIVRLRDLLAADDRGGLDALARELGLLGAATAGLHLDLASAFGVGTGADADVTAALAAAREQLDVALALSEPETAAILRSGTEIVRAALAHLDRLAGAPLIRCHGDLHVGQFIASPDGPVVVDFEGEPGRAMQERRQLASPLRDLACLLLSFDHVAAAAARRLDFGPALDVAFGWSAAARAHAEDAYRAGVAGSALRPDASLLRALEVEKECHEVIYAATVLPEWSYAPELALGRLLERPSPS